MLLLLIVLGIGAVLAIVLIVLIRSLKGLRREMLSGPECHVLRMRSREVICHACLANLAAQLPADIDTTLSEIPGFHVHGVGNCSVCVQFSAVVMFTPRGPRRWGRPRGLIRANIARTSRAHLES